MLAKTNFSLAARVRGDRAAEAALKPRASTTQTSATLERARAAIRRASETIRRRSSK